MTTAILGDRHRSQATRDGRVRWLARGRALVTRWWIMPVILAVVAAALRLPGLEARGQFDADQGNDMMVVWRLLTTGNVPLIGPKASVGDFHQGVLYRLMLLPGARVFGADPLVVMTELAVIGIATVIAVWWLARTVGGPIAGAVAGVLVAISPAEIQNSTTIWIVDPIPLFAAVALGAAWQAWRTARAGWWVVAFACCAGVAQLHLVGPVLAVPVVALYALQLRRARADRTARGQLVKYGLLGGAVAALFYVPLLISEVHTGFVETRNILAYLGSRGDASDPGITQLTLIGSLRSLSFPFSGQITDAPGLAALSAVVVVALGIAAAWWTSGSEKAGARWLLATLVFSVLILAVGAPSMATVVPGLPNDQYHFFLDPVVFTLAGLGVAALWQRVRSSRQRPLDAAPRTGAAATVMPLGLAIAALAVLMVVCVARWPAAADPDGGWPAVKQAGQRIVAASAGTPIGVLSVPAFKVSDATEFSILYAGGEISDVARASTVVVTCDRLFASALSAPCGGPAEDALARDAGLVAPASERFDASSRIAISIYRR